MKPNHSVSCKNWHILVQSAQISLLENFMRFEILGVLCMEGEK